MRLRVRDHYDNLVTAAVPSDTARFIKHEALARLGISENEHIRSIVTQACRHEPYPDLRLGSRTRTRQVSTYIPDDAYGPFMRACARMKVDPRQMLRAILVTTTGTPRAP